MYVVLSTAPPEDAPALARALVEASVAACVNLLPGARSIYAWQGEVCDESETLLICKTADPAALAEVLRARHRYDTPELVVLDVDTASSDPRYVAWVRQLTDPEQR